MDSLHKGGYLATVERRGVVEGFYGPPYTFPQRDSLIRFCGEHGFNLYVYGPKNDRQGRSRWWEPYPAKVMARFGRTIALAQDAGVSFCYAVSPGVSICYAAAEDFGRLQDKLLPFYRLGVRAFALLLDDIEPGFRHAADRAAYPSYGAAHADLCNRTLAWLKQLDPACTLAMCPVDYYGRAPFSAYLHELGECLYPEIDVFYTGPEVCSASITVADVQAFGEAVRRRPMLWDNYPANDLDMKSELHIGPIRGRDPGLGRAVEGIVVNAMVQPEATKIPLATYADYLACPKGYDPAQSWEQALREVGGDECFSALRLFAENSLRSCLATPEAETLERLCGAALRAVRGGAAPGSSPELAALDGYVAALDDARYVLTNWLDNLALREDLLPWLELLDLWCWMARRALIVIYAWEREEPYEQALRWMREWLEAIQRHPKRICGEILLALAAYVLEQAEERTHA